MFRHFFEILCVEETGTVHVQCLELLDRSCRWSLAACRNTGMAASYAIGLLQNGLHCMGAHAQPLLMFRHFFEVLRVEETGSVHVQRLELLNDRVDVALLAGLSFDLKKKEHTRKRAK